MGQRLAKSYKDDNFRKFDSIKNNRYGEVLKIEEGYTTYKHGEYLLRVEKIERGVLVSIIDNKTLNCILR